MLGILPHNESPTGSTGSHLSLNQANKYGSRRPAQAFVDSAQELVPKSAIELHCVDCRMKQMLGDT